MSKTIVWELEKGNYKFLHYALLYTYPSHTLFLHPPTTQTKHFNYIATNLLRQLHHASYISFLTADILFNLLEDSCNKNCTLAHLTGKTEIYCDMNMNIM